MAENRSAAGPGRHPAPSADARGVHDAHGLAVPVELGVDGVAGGARHVADDDPLLAGERVEQRALAHVGTTDDGDTGHGAMQRDIVGLLGRLVPVDRPPPPGPPGSADSPTTKGSGANPSASSSASSSTSASRRLRSISEGRFLGQRPDDGVEQVTGAPAVLGADGVGLLPAHAVGLGRLQLALLVVGLVGDHDDRRPGAPQELGRLVVRGCQTGGGVDHEQDDVRLGDGQASLVLDLLLDGVARAVAPGRRCR